MIAMTEREDLEERIAEAGHQHDVAVALWEAQAHPVQKRITDNLDWYDLSGDLHALKLANVARADLRMIGPRPEEPLSLAMLRGRLHRIESGR